MTMQRRPFLIVGSWLVVTRLVEAQTPKAKAAHIGILVGGGYAQRGHLERAFLDGMREQGYVEGKNLVVERRYAEGRLAQVPELARELALLKLDAVITTCSPTTQAARQAIGSTSIVMAAVSDPVGQRLIASLAKPGGNITGLSSQAEDILPKMVELFAGILTKPVTLAVFAEAKSAVHPTMWRQLAPIAEALKLKLLRIDVAQPADLPKAFDMALRQNAEALFFLPDEPMFLTQRTPIVELAAKSGLPALYGAREFVDAGGLMSYGENLRTAYRNVAAYINQLVQGAKPADLPVAQPSKFELVINAKTAKTLGISIPQSLLLRADEVIQ